MRKAQLARMVIILHKSIIALLFSYYAPAFQMNNYCLRFVILFQIIPKIFTTLPHSGKL